MNKIFITLALISVISTNIYAAELSGYAENTNQTEAKNNAALDLQYKTTLSILGRYDKINYENNAELIKKNYRLFSLLNYTLPDYLIVTSKQTGEVFTATATHQEPIKYIEKINSLTAEIYKRYNATSVLEKKYRVTALMELLRFYDEYDYYNALLSALLLTDHKIPELSYNTLVKEILAEQSKRNTLEELALILTSTAGKSKTYLYPITSDLYQETSQFSLKLAELIRKNINSVETDKDADLTLRCHYSLDDETLTINCNSFNDERKIITSSVAMITVSELDGITHKGRYETIIDKLTSSDFTDNLSVSLRYITNESSPLFVTENNQFALQAKINQPAFLQFIAYYIDNDSASASTIYRIYPGGEEEIFIGAENIDKWITIGKFRAVEPLGMEMITAYARTVRDDNVSFKTVFKEERMINADLLLTSIKINKLLSENEGEKARTTLPICTR